MTHEALLDRTLSLLDQSGLRQGALFHEASGTHLLRHEAPSGQNATVYRPLLCLVLQGAKEVGTNTKTITVRAGQSLIVSHALPVLSRITEAAPDLPYVALVFPLDLDLLRSLAPAVSPSANTRPSEPFSIHLCDTDEEIDDALRRYFKQCETVAARRLLAPITAREIHARLLMGQHGETLHKLLWHESAASRIFEATRNIQTHLARTIVVKELARDVGMSSSAFFEQFKAVTGTSPLQYQKDLRLLRARDALQTSSAKVSEIAFGVGYESSAQFSREYSRKFGRSPRQDRELVAFE
ncbi:AraC family transcriptional regulator N-terminal domain-containing protein [Oricola indica]|uniref:AraC family transcriptional regulator n=1 Tax=Oricola indica TaxID=2872591 RepID=UPI003CCBF77C